MAAPETQFRWAQREADYAIGEATYFRDVLPRLRAQYLQALAASNRAQLAGLTD